MRISIELSREDIAFLDDYAERHGRVERSAALTRAVELLRQSELGPAYEVAWDDWHKSGESAVWAAVEEDAVSDPTEQA